MMVPKKTSERSSHPRGVDVKHAAVILLHGTSIIIQEAPPFCLRWNVWSAWAFTGQKQEKFSAVRGNRWGSLSPAGESIGQVVTPSRKHIQDVQSPSQHKGTLLILPGSQTPSSSGRGLVFFPRMEPSLPLDMRIERHRHQASGFTTALRLKDSDCDCSGRLGHLH